jgi:membrane-associated tyrosine- and threonine-specific cdc2-inhibitory kinase
LSYFQRARYTVPKCPEPIISSPMNICNTSTSFNSSHENEKSEPSYLTLAGYDDSKKESYFEQMFIGEEIIGSGHFGTVYRARWKYDNKYYAIKKSKLIFKSKNDRERRLQEVAKHENLPKHPNLVEFIQAWEEKLHLYIQFELCECTLAEYIEKHPYIPEKTVWSFLADLLMGLAHLHDHNLIHLDIKPENIFIKDGICKLGDFGLVYDLNNSSSTYEATEGDPKYMAQELMSGIFTKSADIFSLGITILEISCDLDLPSCGDGFHLLRSGTIPFNGMDTSISTELQNIICAMMSPDYNLRPSAHDLLNHSRIKFTARKRICKVYFFQSAKKVKDFLTRLLAMLYVFYVIECITYFFGWSIGSNGEKITKNKDPIQNSSTANLLDLPWSNLGGDRDSTPESKLNTASLFDYYIFTDDEESRPNTPCSTYRSRNGTPVMPYISVTSLGDDEDADDGYQGNSRSRSQKSTLPSSDCGSSDSPFNSSLDLVDNMLNVVEVLLDSPVISFVTFVWGISCVLLSMLSGVTL